MQVLELSQLVLKDNGKMKVMTYKPPVRNNAHSPTFSARGSCNFLNIGIAAIRMAKSVTTQGIVTTLARRGTLPQWPWICGSQYDFMGEQINAYPKVEAKYHTITIAPSIRAVSWNSRVTKIR